MASIFKPKGKARYVIIYTDENGRRRKKVGTRDKGVTERIARDLENRVALRREGLIDQVAESCANNATVSVADHLADWDQNMMDQGKTAKHGNQYRERAGKLVALIKGTRLADIEPGRKPEALTRAAVTLANVLKTARLFDLTAERIQAALASLRAARKANQTANHYRAALRAFMLWCVKEERLSKNPMRGVCGYNAEEDSRHPRRSLTDDDLAWLVQTAEHAPDLFGMPGSLRALAYRTAAATGFRADELRSLTPASFRLATSAPSVFLHASSTKNRRPADQHIPQALVPDLQR
jgi:hypothetical protein